MDNLIVYDYVPQEEMPFKIVLMLSSELDPGSSLDVDQFARKEDLVDFLENESHLKGASSFYLVSVDQYNLLLESSSELETLRDELIKIGDFVENDNPEANLSSFFKKILR
jgi:hypothetical protein